MELVTPAVTRLQLPRNSFTRALENRIVAPAVKVSVFAHSARYLVEITASQLSDGAWL